MMFLAVMTLATVSSASPFQEDQVKALIEAAAAGDLDKVNAALKAGADVNGTVRTRWTALHAAAERARGEVVKRLLEAKANPNVEDPLGVTPLHWASCRGPVESAKALITAGADVNAYCVQFDTPLGTAAAAGQVEIAAELLKAKADVNGGKSLKPLALAAKYSQIEMIRLLVKNGATINDEKDPPLHWAKEPDVAKALLELGAKLELRNPDGETALHLPRGPFWGANAETVKALIELKADVNARDKTNATPLHGAIRQKRLDVVKVLLEGGADIDARDEKGNTPLSLAERAGKEFLSLLKARGAKEDGKPPLQRAIEAGDVERVKALIKGGEKVSATCPGGKTLVHIASELGQVDALDELIRAGAKVDEVSEHGARPLDCAATAAIVDRLIAAGAKICHPQENPFAPTATSLFAAAIDGRADVVRALLKQKAQIKASELTDAIPWAAFAGRLEVVRVFLDEGIGPNPAESSRTQSALHVAACGGIGDTESPKHVTREVRLKIAQLLIDKGADVNGKAQSGYFFDCTPLIAASMSGFDELAKLLLDKGADVNAAAPNGTFAGQTALHTAAEGGHAKLVKLLVERKAPVNVVTGKKHYKGVVTPLDLAKNDAVRKVLRDSGGKLASELESDK